MSTPQIRSRELLTKAGWLVATVEGRKEFPDKKKSACRVCGHQPTIRITADLFGCFDLACFHPERGGTLLVQVTSQANHSTRKNKILSSFEAKLVLLAGAQICIQSWRKGKSVGCGNRWECRHEDITLKDFAQAPHYPNTVRDLVEIRRKAKKPDLPPGATLPLCTIPDEQMPF